MPETTILFSADKEHPCYTDHFPGRAVVPGALLLEWIVQALSQSYPALHVTGIPSFKFLLPVYPGDSLQLRLQWDDNKTGVRVECLRVQMNDHESVARGKLMCGVAR